MFSETVNRRIKESIAISMIGDGVVALMEPRRHALLWEGGPAAWRKLMQPFAKRPGLTRLLAVLEIMGGIWLASNQLRGKDTPID